MKNLLALLICCFIMSSCSDRHNSFDINNSYYDSFPVDTAITPDFAFSPELSGSFLGMSEYDGMLFLLTNKMPGGPIQVYKGKNGEYVRRIGTIGRGPNELLIPSFIGPSQNGRQLIVDPSARITALCDLKESLEQGIVCYDTIFNRNDEFMYYFNNNEKTISLLDNVFTLKDMTVDIIDTIFYYENDYSRLYTYIPVVNFGLNKIVLAMSHKNMLCCYDWSKDIKSSVSMIYKDVDNDKLIEVEDNYIFPKYEFYRDITANSSYIYTLFAYNERYIDENTPVNYLQIFDWNLSPIMSVTIQENLHTLLLSSDGANIYGYGYDNKVYVYSNPIIKYNENIEELSK